jgi:hypothetical protein
MEPLWSPAGATSRNRWQTGGGRKRLRQAKSVAVRCQRLGRYSVATARPSGPLRNAARYPARSLTDFGDTVHGARSRRGTPRHSRANFSRLRCIRVRMSRGVSIGIWHRIPASRTRAVRQLRGIGATGLEPATSRVTGRVGHIDTSVDQRPAARRTGMSMPTFTASKTGSVTKRLTPGSSRKRRSTSSRHSCMSPVTRTTT